MVFEMEQNQLIWQNIRELRNNPKRPGKILSALFDPDDVFNFLDELYNKLNLQMCPRHLTTEISGNGLKENWRPPYWDRLDNEPTDETKKCICRNLTSGP